MDIVELLQREIQDLKMKAGKLIEENVVLRGFKAMVMQDPKKYNHNTNQQGNYTKQINIVNIIIIIIP